MGKHRFDEHNRDKWGGPDLVSTKDGRQSIGAQDTTASRPAGDDDHGGATVEPAPGGNA